MEWTDGRLDDLAKRVDDGFDEVRGDIAKLDGKIAGLDKKLDAKIAGLDKKLDAKIDRVDAKIGDLQTLLLRYAFTTTSGILAGVAVITIRALTNG